ncbi:hypothetical protein [Pseudomonas sp. SO81]|jgi:hypothetical protein|uniref:hypothetical protein n=1 Tax=Pseudomonas sp. SO81 TaxID=2983246 RepID=UPI0025A3E43B|nr:hypothetical protein [Pseudomonas sp. SO81]
MESIIEAARAMLGNTYFIVATLIGLITVILTILTRLLDFHDRHVVHKKYERLRKLREYTPEGTSLAGYLDGSIQGEVFRIASGISASPEKMKYMLELASMGRWDHSQLRSISGFVRLEPDADEPSICMGRSSKLDAIFCLFAGGYFIFVGVVFLLLSGVFLPSPFGWIAGAGICLVFFICAVGMWKGYVNYLIAKRAKAYLETSQPRGVQESANVVIPVPTAAA